MVISLRNIVMSLSETRLASDKYFVLSCIGCRWFSEVLGQYHVFALHVVLKTHQIRNKYQFSSVYICLATDDGSIFQCVTPTWMTQMEFWPLGSYLAKPWLLWTFLERTNDCNISLPAFLINKYKNIKLILFYDSHVNKNIQSFIGDFKY